MPRTDDDTCPAEDGNAPSPLVAYTIFDPFLLRIVVTDDGFCLGISLLDLSTSTTALSTVFQAAVTARSLLQVQVATAASVQQAIVAVSEVQKQEAQLILQELPVLSEDTDKMIGRYDDWMINT